MVAMGAVLLYQALDSAQFTRFAGVGWAEMCDARP